MGTCKASLGDIVQFLYYDSYGNMCYHKVGVEFNKKYTEYQDGDVRIQYGGKNIIKKEDHSQNWWHKNK